MAITNGPSRTGVNDERMTKPEQKLAQSPFPTLEHSAFLGHPAFAEFAQLSINLT
jgi:hypothetical protein